MVETSELKVFYTLPSSIEDPPYLRWCKDSNLKRYVLGLVADRSTQLEVVTVAQILIERLSQFPSQRKDYAPSQTAHSGCVTALLASIVFSTERSRWLRFDLLPKLEIHGSSLEIRDVYAIGLEIISDSASFLRNYNPGNFDYYERLCAYSYGKFRRSTIDRLRVIPELRNFARTNLGLLVRARWSRVEKALIESGERGERLARLSLLHQCLQETVTAKQFETQNPQATHYAALLTRYRDRATVTDLEISDLEQLERLLISMGTTLRSYKMPKIVSLDLPVGNEMTGKTTTLGDFVEAMPIDAEIQIQSQQARQVVVNSFDRLSQSNPSADRLLFLLYGLNLTQADAGVDLNINQATVMRRRDRILAELAKHLHQELLPSQNLIIEEIVPYIDYVTLICKEYYFRKTQ